MKKEGGNETLPPQKASKNPAPNLLLIRSGKQNKSFSISNLPNILWLYPIVNGG